MDVPGHDCAVVDFSFAFDNPKLAAYNLRVLVPCSGDKSEQEAKGAPASPEEAAVGGRSSSPGAVVSAPAKAPLTGTKRSRSDDGTTTPEEGPFRVEAEVAICPAILGGRSNFFRKMFEGDFLEASASTVDITLESKEVGAFMVLLRFIHSGMLPNLTFKGQMLVLKLADKFDTPACVKMCSSLLAKSLPNPLTVSDAVALFELSKVIAAIPESVTKAAASRIVRVVNDGIGNSQGFNSLEMAQLSDAAMERILEGDDVAVDYEHQLVEAAVEWIRVRHVDNQGRLDAFLRVVWPRLRPAHMHPAKTRDAICICVGLVSEEPRSSLEANGALAGMFESVEEFSESKVLSETSKHKDGAVSAAMVAHFSALLVQTGLLSLQAQPLLSNPLQYRPRDAYTPLATGYVGIPVDKGNAACSIIGESFSTKIQCLSRWLYVGVRLKKRNPQGEIYLAVFLAVDDTPRFGVMTNTQNIDNLTRVSLSTPSSFPDYELLSDRKVDCQSIQVLPKCWRQIVTAAGNACLGVVKLRFDVYKIRS